MAATNNFGNNTISVGSLSELAGIITNFPPEQLQNVRLDSSLYEALSKSVESNPVQVHGQQGIEELQQAQVLQNQIITIADGTPVQNTGNIIVTPSIANNGILNSLDNVSNTILDPQQVNNIGLVTTLTNGDISINSVTNDLISPIKTNIVQQPPVNYQLLQQQQQQHQSTATPILAINKGTLPVVTQVVPNQTFVMQNMNVGQAASLQGILPGEASSLILTPTFMSQVQPTATIQTINISDAQIIQNAPPTSLNPGTDSMILSPTAVQAQGAMQPINLSNQHHPTTLTLDEQGQIIQLPIVSNTSIIPSTITIDQSLLKLNTADTITNPNVINNLTNIAGGTCGTTIPILQNIPLQQATTTNQCILVDGNIISGNTIVGQVISPGNLPVQQMLVSDINPTAPATLVLNALAQQQQQTLTQFPPSVTPLVTSTTVNISPVAPNKKQPVVINSSSVQPPKKAKTIQTISNFSPQSSVFNQLKTTKSGTTSLGGNKQTSGRNVIVKKTINVIKKSESTVVPMKPTSVEQVQPGVFKFQLKKVDTNEVDFLLENTTAETSTTPVRSTTKINTNYHIAIPPLPGSSKKETSTQMLKTSANSTIQVVTSRLKPTSISATKTSIIPTLIKNSTPEKVWQNLGTLKNTSISSTVKSTPHNTTNNSINQRHSTKSLTKVPFNSPARASQIHSSKGPSTLATTISAQKQLQKTTTASNTATQSPKTTLIKSITVPKDVLSKLKGQAVGNVLKITDTELLNQLVALSKAPKKNYNKSSNIAATSRASTTATKITLVSKSTSKVTSENATVQKAVISKTTLPTLVSTKLSAKTTNTKSSTTPQSVSSKLSTTPSNILSKLSFTPSKFSTKFSPSNICKKSSFVHSSILTSTERCKSPEKIFIPAPRTVNASILTQTLGSQSLTKKTLGTTKKHQSSNPSLKKVSTKQQPVDSGDSELDTGHDLECKESSFVVSPLSTSVTLSTSSEDGMLTATNITECLVNSKDPVLILEKVAKPMSIETSKENEKGSSMSQDESEEVHTIRQAIKSSHVGEQENQMRNLARQEIENQLKRFSQKEKKTSQDDVVPITKTSVGKRYSSSNSNPPAKRKKIEAATSSTTSVTTESQQQQQKTTQQRNTKHQSLPTRKKHLRKKFANKTQTVIEESRKRERPKKFEDFILAPKTKKEKKTRKFFFPKDESAADGTEDEVESADKENDSSFYDLTVNENELDENEQLSTSTTESSKKNSTKDLTSTIDKIPSKVSDSASKKPNTSTSQQPPKKQSKKKSTSINTTKKTTEINVKKKISHPKGSVKKTKKRKQKSIAFEPEVLPEHLKIKSKHKLEDAVIDLTKVKLKSAFAETSYTLDDAVNSETYKLLNRKIWICTLCGKPGNLGSLDVLFGPYKIQVKIEKNNKTKKDREEAVTTTDTKMNVWLHRDCAIWTSNICLSNQTLCGLGESLDEAAVTKCCLCSKVGATLQCGFKQCRDGYHFVCAKQRGCAFQMENFTITCPKHK